MHCGEPLSHWTERPVHYALLTPLGALTFATTSIRELRQILDGPYQDGACERCWEDVPDLHRLGAYYSVPLTAPDRRPRNVWADAFIPAPSRGPGSLQGPVAFISGHQAFNNLTEDQSHQLLTRHAGAQPHTPAAPRIATPPSRQPMSTSCTY